MTARQDLDRVLRDWIAEGPTRLSGETLATTLAQVHATRQIGRRRPWRPLPATGRRRLWAVAAIAVTVLALAFVILRPPITEQAITVPSPTPAATATPGTTASPSPVATATPKATTSPTPSPSSALTSSRLVVGPLPAGTYTSTVMDPTVTFTTPSQLIVRYDKTENVWLATGYALGAPEFNVLRSDEHGVVDRLATDKRASASRIANVTIGGLPARTVELTVAADAYAPQVRNLYSSAALVVTGLREAGWYVYVLPGFRATVIELTVQGKDVLVFWQAPVAQYADWTRVAQQIAESLAFPP
jgi:hypothetical protein